MSQWLFSFDQLFTGIPVLVRIIIWGLTSGAMAIFLYKLLSNQEKISKCKQEVQQSRQALMSNDITFEEYKALASQSLKSSLKLLAIVIIPTLISIAPIIAIATMLDKYFADLVLFNTSYSWLSSWEALYFVCVFSSALGLKLSLKIH